MTILKIISVTVVGLMLSACAETQFLMHTAKRMKKEQRSTYYKVGNPYQINGAWYYPAENWNYDETGVASWYGPQFDGKLTANGETFDQWQVSAAHKTLPMPSIVRVTNLENGRSLVVRVNDRGPYARGRIIDMSRRAAQMLGFEGKGTAKVRVAILSKESRALAERLKSGEVLTAEDMPQINSDNLSQEPVASKTLEKVQVASIEPAPQIPPTPNEAHVGDMSSVSVSPTKIYIQAGAFSDLNNAERVLANLEKLGNATISPIQSGGRELFRVRLGPISEVSEADALLEKVGNIGYPNARTVVEETTIN
ncbi:MAG: septal ring lytic transglycosylase RlpA family protein [Rhodospirillaceae bacterium]|nr:septal ring lytic transglycosylase RlpA family protein [Rhodospirillaceae bacterium]